MNNVEIIAPAGFGWMLLAYGLVDIVVLLVCSAMLVIAMTGSL